MPKYRTLRKLVEAVRRGDVAEDSLRVFMDNDCSSVMLERPGVDEGEHLYEGKGYHDTEDLWPLLFPTATVDWC